MKEIQKLINTYTPLSVNERLEKFYSEFHDARILVTSSMGNTSPVLMKMIMEANPKQVITFIDTGYHFKETIFFKDRLEKILGLNMKIVGPSRLHHQPTEENKLWNIDPDFCCLVNKVFPIRELVKEHDVWVSGLLAYQNENRRGKQLFEQRDILKFYPILDMKEEEVIEYNRRHNLPAHPLSVEGYGSVGCFHCTKKEEGRKGRWDKFEKTECGLHG